MPTTPTSATLNVAHATAGPSSPPQTPTTLSPTYNRRGLASSAAQARVPKNLKPISYASVLKGPSPDELSPQSSDESSEEEEDEEEDDSDAESDEIEMSEVPIETVEKDIELKDVEDSDSDIGEADIDEADDDEDDDESDEDDPSDHDEMTDVDEILTTVVKVDIEVVEYTSDFECIEVIQPTTYEECEVEEPDSDDARSRRFTRNDLPASVLRGVRDMRVFNSDSESEEENDEFMRTLRANRAGKRLRRMTSGSISKRTVSERDSDSDKEDLMPFEEMPIGTQRRTRRKTDRFSFQMIGQHFESIQELKEPNSDDEISLEDSDMLARELPYFTYFEVQEH